MRWAGHVARMGERRSACRVLMVGDVKGKVHPRTGHDNPEWE